MGETLALFRPSFNGSVRVETRPERLSGDAGFLLLREALVQTGIIDHLALAARLRAANRGRRRNMLTIDIDGLPLAVHGQQAGSAYNGHVGARIHYPLIASCAETGDRLAGLLRPGNTAPGAEAKVSIPQLVEAAEREICQRAQVRLHAGFTDSETLEALDARGIGYIGRLRDNAALQRLFDPHRRRGPGRPAKRPREWVVESPYRADSWARECRVLIVVQERPDELFRHCFYLVTNLSAPPTQLLALYRRRGKDEGHMGKLKDGFGASLPSTSRGAASEATVLALAQDRRPRAALRATADRGPHPRGRTALVHALPAAPTPAPRARIGTEQSLTHPSTLTARGQHGIVVPECAKSGAWRVPGSSLHPALVGVSRAPIAPVDHLPHKR